MAQIPRFKVYLKDAHDATGLSPYMVGKKTGVSTNTVARYVSENGILTDRIEGVLLALINFYGLDWRDPKVVEIIEDTTEGQEETLLAEAV
ncbi:MAG: hypothetical protein CL607_14835 [Anaerolineaceae bacterium]|nr:hypothetical protein [Anaerolineaceae bacterium]